jgi:hypothetical protein
MPRMGVISAGLAMMSAAAILTPDPNTVAAAALTLPITVPCPAWHQQFCIDHPTLNLPAAIMPNRPSGHSRRPSGYHAAS